MNLIKKNALKERTHRLIIRVQDKSKEIITDKNGNRFLPTKWVEVQEVNLGSIKTPNKEIIEVVLEPIKFSDVKDHKQEKDDKCNNPFQKWFDPWM